MTPVDWALGMVSILMSLALGDITLSFHRLMRFRRKVQWHAPTLIAAALVIETIIRMWFLVWNIRNVSAVLSFPFYFSMFVDYMLLFLLAAACLPEETDGGISLADFYEEHRRYFWTVFSLFHALFIAHFIYFAQGNSGAVLRTAIEAAPLILFVALIVWRNRWLHVIGPAGLFLFYFLEFWSAVLSERVQ